MIADLHTHSSCSDGILSPRELMSRAKVRGVDVIALTDHDTLAGLEEARTAACELGLTLVDGIELSALWGRLGVHIVGLGIDSHHPEMLALVARQQTARAERNRQIAERLQALGLENALARAEVLAAGDQPGRPHFAQLLVADGLAKDMAQAFKKYLGTGKRADVRFAWPAMAGLIDAVRVAGGVAVLAHPLKYGLTRTRLRGLISDFAAAGGQAIEVASGQQTAADRQMLVQLAHHFDLAASWGSDFHRPDQPWQELGVCGAPPPDIRLVWREGSGLG